MKIKLLNIKIHQFLAFGDAELSLNNRGYCLLTGHNHDPRDNATSNGSGKSSLISAICWALTGETVQEVKTNVANIQLNSGCWVELTFDVDSHHYVITRYRDDPKFHTYLKIIVDGNDVSGKTLSDSEEQLNKYLPDLTSELISSVIILGQGLPHKFSNYKPSGRKNLLEKLSKSDFMIEDIKERINKRSYDLNISLRQLEDSALSLNTKLDLYKNQLEQETSKLNELSESKNFDTEINYLNEEIERNNKLLVTTNHEVTENTEIYNNYINQKNLISESKNTEINSVKDKYNNEKSDSEKEKYKIMNDLNILTKEVNNLKSIKDVCPTCGHKLEGVVKPDTTKQEAEIKTLNESLAYKNKSLNDLTEEYNKTITLINNKFSTSLEEIDKKIAEASESKNSALTKQKAIESDLNKFNIELTKVNLEKENYAKNIEKSKKTIADLTLNIKNTEETIEKTNKDNDNLFYKINNNNCYCNKSSKSYVYYIYK